MPCCLSWARLDEPWKLCVNLATLGSIIMLSSLYVQRFRLFACLRHAYHLHHHHQEVHEAVWDFPKGEHWPSGLCIGRMTRVTADKDVDLRNSSQPLDV